MHRRIQRVMLTSSLGFVILAWGGGGDGTDIESTFPGERAAVAPEPFGVLRIADFSDVTTFDPALTQSTQASYLYPVYDTLLRQLPGGDLAPHLATSWSQPEPTTWRFVLRDDVAFHDGSPFDATAVKANLERAKATPGNPNAPTYTSLSDVVVVDPTTVDVRFAVRNPTFPLEMSMVQGMMISPNAISRGVDLTRDPQGSGGWIWNKDASQVGARQVYELNESYWAEDLQGVERIEINVIVENGARFTALETGQVDIELAAPASQIAAAEGNGFSVNTHDVEAHWIQIMDRAGTQVEALADRRVRQAIAHAIDREGYVRAVLGGAGSASGGLVSPVLSDWYEPALADLPTFDPMLSRELLTAAGYADGFELDLPMLPAIQTNVEAIAQMLEAVGIRVNLVQLQSGQLGPELRKGSFSVAVLVVPQYDPHNTFSVFASSFSPYNPFHVGDSESVDEALDRAAGADPGTARSIYADVARELIEQGVMIPVAFGPVVIITATNVTGTFVPLGVHTALPLGVRVDG